MGVVAVTAWIDLRGLPHDVAYAGSWAECAGCGPDSELAVRVEQSSAPVAGTVELLPPGRRLRPVPASTVTTRRLRWLWRHRVLLGGLTLLAGRDRASADRC